MPVGASRGRRSMVPCFRFPLRHRVDFAGCMRGWKTARVPFHQSPNWCGIANADTSSPTVVSTPPPKLEQIARHVASLRFGASKLTSDAWFPRPLPRWQQNAQTVVSGCWTDVLSRDLICVPCGLVLRARRAAESRGRGQQPLQPYYEPKQSEPNGESWVPTKRTTAMQVHSWQGPSRDSWTM
jgi:hypothetical protein